jgi:hypothetical protein
MGPIRCPETSVNNYHTTQRNIPEEHRAQNIEYLIAELRGKESNHWALKG